jgi:hypothetical protein
LFAVFIGGLGAAFETTGASEIIGLGTAAVILGIIGIIGGILLIVGGALSFMRSPEK